VAGAVKRLVGWRRRADRFHRGARRPLMARHQRSAGTGDSVVPLMGVFGATEKEMYEDMKRARDMWQQECSARTAENMDS
jgi:hypothetical protein